MDKKKLTFADFPDEINLNQTDLDLRQAALDAADDRRSPDRPDDTGLKDQHVAEDLGLTPKPTV